MKFNVPLGRLAALEKTINKYARKSATISISTGNEVVCDGSLHILDPITHTESIRPIKIRCIEVEVNGSYVIEGWQFVGTVQFTPNGNIIRLANSSFEGKVPERYNHSAPICEHCGTIRSRKDAYLIYNTETGDFKQVGRNCLREYTSEFNAEECAAIMACLDRFQNLEGHDLGWDEFLGKGYGPSNAGVSSLLVKGFAIALVKKFGYCKSDSSTPTVSDMFDLIFGNPRANARITDLTPDYSIIDEITAFAKGITDTYGYMYNAKLAWLNDYAEARDFGLIASFVASYLRNQEKISENKASGSEYVGNIGDKIEFQVSSARVISFNDQYNTYYYVIKDTKGNTYVWSTGASISEGDTITAKVKAHKEWKGLKQTVITYGKVTSKEVE